jgi:hypothetical protein
VQAFDLDSAEREGAAWREGVEAAALVETEIVKEVAAAEE